MIDAQMIRDFLDDYCDHDGFCASVEVIPGQPQAECDCGFKDRAPAVYAALAKMGKPVELGELLPYEVRSVPGDAAKYPPDRMELHVQEPGCVAVFRYERIPAGSPADKELFVDRPYADPSNPGNAVTYHTDGLCIENGCKEPAGTWWSALWCFKHNVIRMDRIRASLRQIEESWPTKKDKEQPCDD